MQSTRQSHYITSLGENVLRVYSIRCEAKLLLLFPSREFSQLHLELLADVKAEDVNTEDIKFEVAL